MTVMLNGVEVRLTDYVILPVFRYISLSEGM